MKTLLHILVALIIMSVTVEYIQAQNLVPNPSFEDTVSCPTADNQINLSLGWEAFGSPEYFNRCSTSPDVSVPNNWGGYQQPATGDAYAAVNMSGDITFGFNCDVNSCNSREYIGQFLSTPLSIGTRYYITLKTSLSISNTIFVNCATNNIGVLFSMAKPIVPFPMVTNQTLIKNFAHFFDPTIITDTSGWTTITGSFVADSAYQYIIVGNFFDDANTNTQIMDGNTYCNSYYFIDDVCVSNDSLTCYNPTSIIESNRNLNFSIYPNPASNSINILKEQGVKNLNISIYNSIGQILHNEQGISSNNKQINISNYNSGLLFIKIESNDQRYTYKLLKR